MNNSRIGRSNSRLKAGRFRSAIRRTTVLLLAVGLAPLAALAQNSEERVMEEIFVTGSRIARSDLSAPSPTVVVSEEFIESSGNVTLEQTLNQLPQLRPNGTSTSNVTGEAGVLAADLRGLGRNRTLMLVNGKRFAPANADGQSDMASIPMALVDRVEIITGGASAVYGSDAIAGAVNFILKRDFEGLEFDYQYGQSGESDGTTNKLAVTIGGNFGDGRGNAALHASYTDRDEVKFGSRDFSFFSVDPNSEGILVPTGSSNIPGRLIGLGSSIVAGLQNIDLTDFTSSTQFANDGSGACDNADNITAVRFGDGGVPLPFCNPQHRFNVNPPNLLQRPLERVLINGMAHFDISDDVRFYMNADFMSNEQAFQQAPASFVARTPGRNDLLLPDLLNNPLVPQVTKDFFAANADVFDPEGDGDFVVGGLRGRGNEGGPRRFNFIRKSYGLTAGFEGHFEALGTRWGWDSFVQTMEANQTDNVENVLSQARFSQALDVVVDDVTGDVTCRTPTLGCVPINVFGINSLTPAMVEFITPDRGDSSSFSRDIAGVTLTGQPFELPAGPLGVALGAEYREDGYRFLPNAGNEDGPGGAPLNPIDASFDVTEFFIESQVPLLADIPMVQLLSLELAARTSDYSTAGRVSTWKTGIEWTVNDLIRFRSAFNRAVRAPNLNELFTQRTRGFATGNDPCAIDQNPTQAVKDFCVEWGVPAADIDDFVKFSSGFDFVVTGGNPDLFEESSDTFTIGTVISPTFLEGLNVTIDYYDISIEDAVSQISANALAAKCAETQDLGNVFCQAIDRSPTDGQIIEIRAGLANIALQEAQGLDVQADYVFALPSDASLSLGVFASWQFKNEFTQFDGEPSTDCSGVFAGNCSRQGVALTPDFTSLISTRYNRGVFGVGLNLRYIAGFDALEGTTPFRDNIPSEVYAALNANYNLTDKVELYGGVNNVFDAQPTPLGFNLAGDANVDPDIYDLIGRRFFVGMRARF